MAQRRLLLSALIGSSLAQSTSVVSLILPQFDQQTIVGSVRSADATATEYFVACPTGEDETLCGLGSGFVVKEGPSTLEIHMTQSAQESISGFQQFAAYTADLSCVISGDSATCTETIASVEGNGETTRSSSSSSMDTLSGLSSFIVPVTITAGLEKLSGGSGSSPTQTGSTVSNTGTSGQATGTGSAAGTSSSTAGVPRITQQAVLAGVAAVVGGALML